jgi:hypothetical protein
MSSSAIGQFVIGQSPIQGALLTPPPLPIVKQILSYLYWQYRDDEDLQAFVDAYNQISQYYLDWSNATPLGVYTLSTISGQLLDWIALGIYGQVRPALPTGTDMNFGPIDTVTNNVAPINASGVISGRHFISTSDDIFKRVMTWNLYKGDGKRFTSQWLKRRVARFLTGKNGTDPGIQQTYDVSVQAQSFQNGFGRFAFGIDQFGYKKAALIKILNSSSYDPNVLAALQEIVLSRAVNLPFQYQFSVVLA